LNGRFKILACCLAVVVSAFAQFWLPTPASGQDGAVEPGKAEWRARVQKARERVEQLRREGKLAIRRENPLKANDRENARRAMTDEQLRPGDVVATESGFVRFEGMSPDNERVFVPIGPGAGSVK
jgi:hypothetical protein